DRVDHVTAWWCLTGVLEGPGEDAQSDADLGRREPHAACGVLGLEHVLDEGPDLRVDRRDLRCPAVQDRLAVDGDRTDGHGGGAPSGTRTRSSLSASRAPPVRV